MLVQDSDELSPGAKPGDARLDVPQQLGSLGPTHGGDHVREHLAVDARGALRELVVQPLERLPRLLGVLRRAT